MRILYLICLCFFTRLARQHNTVVVVAISSVVVVVAVVVLALCASILAA
jgi:hypothetical protein